MKHSLNLVTDTSNSDSCENYLDLETSANKQIIVLTLHNPYRKIEILASELKLIVNLY